MCLSLDSRQTIADICPYGRLGFVRNDGILSVMEAAYFQEALTQGIGLGKAVGFGLLSVTQHAVAAIPPTAVVDRRSTLQSRAVPRWSPQAQKSVSSVSRVSTVSFGCGTINAMDAWGKPTAWSAAATAFLFRVAPAFTACPEKNEGPACRDGRRIRCLIPKEGRSCPPPPARKAENSQKMLSCGTNLIQAIENKR